MRYVQKIASPAPYTVYLSVCDIYLSVFSVWELYLQLQLVWCKERLRQPIRGKFTQDLFDSHARFKWQGQGSHWARPWPTRWCRTVDCLSLARQARVHIPGSELTLSWIQPKDTVMSIFSVYSIIFLLLPIKYLQIHADTCRYISIHRFMHIPTFHT